MVPSSKSYQGDSTARFREVATEMGFEESEILVMIEAAREITRHSIVLSWHDALSEVMFRATQDQDLFTSLWAPRPRG